VDPARLKSVTDFATFRTHQSTTLVSSLNGNAPDSVTLGNAVRTSGGKQVTEVQLPADHSFREHRLALASALLHWLDGLLVKK
jgi:hypothetical protein